MQTGRFRGINRRAFVNLSAAGIAAAAFFQPWRGTAIAQAPRWKRDPFQLGVASGDPTPDGFVLWTRLVPSPLDPDDRIEGPVEVTLEIAADDNFKTIVRRETHIARPDQAHSIHAEIVGLEPARTYFYRFRSGAAVSRTGRTATAPRFGAQLDRLRFAWASCAHFEQGYFTAYRDMAARDPDVILALGDYIYEVSWGPQVRRQAVNDAVTLDEYRLLHACYKLDPDLQTAHAIAPWLFIWDDHEVANDYQGDIGKMPTGGDPSAFRARRIAAYRAFFEHTPVRLRSQLDPIGRMRMYGECGFGDLIDFTLLDTRQYRARAACPSPGRLEGEMVARATCAELADPSRTILGFDQERFVSGNFMRAPFIWSALVQPTLFGTLWQNNAKGEPAAFNDGWAGFEPARQRLLDMMAARGGESACVVIGGDMHGFWAGEVKQDYARPESKVVAAEFIGSSVTAVSGSFARFTAMLPNNPHIKFFDDRTRGYGLADVTRAQMAVSLMSTPSVWRPDAAFAPIKRYVVDAKTPGLAEA